MSPDTPPRQYTTGRQLAWISFDWAQRPFNLLILTYVFAPFFASVVATNPARGQAAWGLCIGVAGLAIAVLSPILGAASDATGQKKPWIAFFGGMLAVACALLWYVIPGSPWAIHWLRVA